MIEVKKNQSIWRRKFKFLAVLSMCTVCTMYIIISNYLYLSHYEIPDLYKVIKANSSFLDEPITIDIVIAYCNYPLSWVEKDIIQDTLKEFSQASFHFTIMSKCGQEAKIPDFGKMDAVKSVEIVPIDNVGGCDYAYAKFLDDHYMQGRQKRGLPITDSESSASKDVVLFMKDTPRTKKYFHRLKSVFGSYRSFPEMIHMSSKKRDFSCGLAVTPDFSEYHAVHILKKFKKNRYARRGNRAHVSEGRDFNPHGYSNLGDFHSKALKWTFPRQDYTLVCYGGTFAVQQNRLLSLFKDERFSRVIKIIKSALSESESSVAEHYVERTWASLLSEPLTDAEASSLKSTITGISHHRIGAYGTIFIGTDKDRYPKLNIVEKSILSG
jgi:hypothetical protein